MGARTRWGRGLRRGGLDRCCQAGASEEGHAGPFRRRYGLERPGRPRGASLAYAAVTVESALTQQILISSLLRFRKTTAIMCHMALLPIKSQLPTLLSK